jgi:hypothetical protein
MSSLRYLTATKMQSGALVCTRLDVRDDEARLDLASSFQLPRCRDLVLQLGGLGPQTPLNTAIRATVAVNLIEAVVAGIRQACYEAEYELRRKAHFGAPQRFSTHALATTITTHTRIKTRG